MDTKSMTCHECGSSVTDADVFCPYCGISLAAASPAVPEDESLESTIMITPAEAEAMSAKASASEPVSVQNVEEPAVIE
ncbi:MAG: zinc ribbon domain-containing protein, partial [Acidobacteria bacterium]|nr:zinc ribbon domain-containing protein [Acidobacteriota bacterium]